MIRIFKCRNGHSYKSKEPITTSWFEANQELFRRSLIQKKVKANDKCKICGADIVAEDDYVNGKVVMGAARIEK